MGSAGRRTAPQPQRAATAAEAMADAHNEVVDLARPARAGTGLNHGRALRRASRGTRHDGRQRRHPPRAARGAMAARRRGQRGSTLGQARRIRARGGREGSFALDEGLAPRRARAGRPSPVKPPSSPRQAPRARARAPAGLVARERRPSRQGLDMVWAQATSACRIGRLAASETRIKKATLGRICHHGILRFEHWP